MIAAPGGAVARLADRARGRRRRGRRSRRPARRCSRARERVRPPIARALSIAARPARFSSAVGGVQMGCHYVMAMPHCAIAQLRVLAGRPP